MTPQPPQPPTSLKMNLKSWMSDATKEGEEEGKGEEEIIESFKLMRKTKMTDPLIETVIVESQETATVTPSSSSILMISEVAITISKSISLISQVRG